MTTKDPNPLFSDDLRQELTAVSPPVGLGQRVLDAAQPSLAMRRATWRRHAVALAAAGVLGFVSFFGAQSALLSWHDSSQGGHSQTAGEFSQDLSGLRDTFHEYELDQVERSLRALAEMQGEAQ
jgi:hypothetical protein